ncbi:MAG: hypothetical protein K2P95_04610 [Hyphomonadaceae bacterium]|nr:hypothetical protein [Hyphomonadaceae bacterium]
MSRVRVIGLCAVLAMAGCSQQPPSPTWAAPGETVRYRCEGQAILQIAFSSDGRGAMVEAEGRTLNLRFLEERGEQEVFAGDGFTLSLDPEATLVRPDGSFVGPCRSGAAP